MSPIKSFILWLALGLFSLGMAYDMGRDCGLWDARESSDVYDN